MVALVHETPESWLIVAPAGFGLVTTDQVVPSQRCTEVLLRPGAVIVLPTAMQLVVLVHDTPSNVANDALIGLGLGVVDHVTPFHCSANVCRLLNDRSNAELVARPTAMQFPSALHETAASWVRVAPGLGLMTFYHLLPFQRWMRVTDAPDSSGA